MSLRPAIRLGVRPLWHAAVSPSTTHPRRAIPQRRCYSKNAEEDDEDDVSAPNTITDELQIMQRERAGLSFLIETMTPYGSTQNDSNTWNLRDSLRRPPVQATISALLAAGAHFGHASSRMNPNFVPYAYGTRAGITIIDLDHTLPLLRRAANVVRAVARAGGQIVFIGTRPDIRPVVERASERIGPQSYYVGERWIPGTLTNRRQFFSEDTLQNFKVIPDLVVLLNPLQNMIAISECASQHIPTIGIVDSNVDPRIVMYPIPANDESTRAAELIGGVLSIAGREGVALRNATEQKRTHRDASSRMNYRRQ